MVAVLRWAPLLVLVLLAPLAAAQSAPAASVTLRAEEAGAWNGASCMRIDAVSGAVWVPRGARVQAVTLEGAAAAWRAHGADALWVEGGAGEACVRFDVAEARPVLARFVAPRAVDLALVVEPPTGRAPLVPGVEMAGGTAADGRASFAGRVALAAGESVTVRVVSAGRIGETPLLLTVLALALLVLAGTMLYHALRPPLGGKPAERLVEHLAELQARVLPAASLFALLNVFYFLMGLRLVRVGGWPVPAPTLGVEGAVASRAFDAFAERLVPAGVTLVALRPVDAVLAHVQTALFLAFLTVLPLLLYELAMFLAPALERHERRALLAVLPVLTLLFLGGALFGYLVMAPLMIATLYGYAPGIGAVPLLGVGDLVSFALLVMLAFAVAFELPVAMYGLARLGVVRAATFLRHVRHAVVVIVVLAGVLTPDPSVVSQLLVAGPVTGLYLVGVVAARFAERRRGLAQARAALSG